MPTIGSRGLLHFSVSPFLVVGFFVATVERSQLTTRDGFRYRELTAPEHVDVFMAERRQSGLGLHRGSLGCVTVAAPRP